MAVVVVVVVEEEGGINEESEDGGGGCLGNAVGVVVPLFDPLLLPLVN